MRHTRTFVLAGASLLLAGCWGDAFEKAPSASANEVVAAPGERVLRVRLVDGDSAPLGGLVPVASDGPSLMSAMVSDGAPSDGEGISALTFPTDKWVYIHGVDPAGEFMAANYVELQPGDAVGMEESVDLKMTAAASVTATLHDDQGTPIVGDGAALIMIHPAHGQWWRAASAIDADGGVAFSGLPAGVFALKIELGGLDAATIREVVLNGGEAKDLGVIIPHSGE